MILSGFKLDGFLCSLLLAVGLAIIFPSLGASDGPLHVDLIAKFGVVLIFFFSGLGLDPAKMRAGLPHITLHFVIQGMTFIVFPTLLLLVQAVAKAHLPLNIWIGFSLVAALPGTVSLSIAMTAKAGGNVPAATFNAMISSFIGIVATPLLMACFLSQSSAPLDLGHVLPRVAMLVLLPIIIGMIARRWLAAWLAVNKPKIQFIDRTIMVSIVFNCLCDSIFNGAWPPNSLALVIAIVMASLALFCVAYVLVTIVCALLGLSPQDRIAGTFCAATKSLVTGAPLASLMFSGNPALGMIVTPIIAYHVWQLVLLTALANQAKRNERRVTPGRAPERQGANLGATDMGG